MLEVRQTACSELSKPNDKLDGQLTGNPHDFIEFLSTIDAQLLSLNRARASLEEYFVQQLRERGITSSQ